MKINEYNWLILIIILSMSSQKRLISKLPVSQWVLIFIASLIRSYISFFLSFAFGGSGTFNSSSCLRLLQRRKLYFVAAVSGITSGTSIFLISAIFSSFLTLEDGAKVFYFLRLDGYVGGAGGALRGPVLGLWEKFWVKVLFSRPMLEGRPISSSS